MPHLSSRRLGPRTILRATAGLALVALTVVSCSSGAASAVPAPSAAAAVPAATPVVTVAPTAAPAATATPTAAATPAAAASPSPDSATAAKAYLLAVTAMNTAFKELNAKLPFPSRTTLAQFNVWGSGMAQADTTFQKEIRSITFPSATASLMIPFLAVHAKVTDMFLKVARATTVNEAITYYNDGAAQFHLAAPMAAAIRRQLGLPAFH